ncbi:MAG: hypothetical protein ACTHQQ_03665, partial [Solirubrobacteraceae bacterium]
MSQHPKAIREHLSANGTRGAGPHRRRRPWPSDLESLARLGIGSVIVESSEDLISAAMASARAGEAP